MLGFSKMFKCTTARLPVIASFLPLWRQVVKGADCGPLIDPLAPTAIADAMRWVLDHPEEAEAMGRRGRDAVERLYHWEPESEKLVGLYQRLLGRATREAAG